MKNSESKELIEVKNNIFTKFINWLKSFRQKFANTKVNEVTEIPKNIVNEENIYNNEIIIKAKEAYKNYVLKSDYKLGENIYKLIKQRISANKKEIENLIQINKDATTYSEIIEVLDKEEKNLKDYKKTNIMSKIDNKFMFSQYQVPVGIIAIKTNDSYIAMQNIFRAVGTRNAIVVIEDNYNEYSIERLVLLIVQETLKKFNINENIIQIIDKNLISKEDLKAFDIIVSEDGKTLNKVETDKMYIYEEDEYFEDTIEKEVKRLKISGKNVEVLKGEMEDCIEKINKDRAFGVCIYTKDRKKAYKFINLVNSENVFFNGTLLNAKKTKKISSVYLTLKNLVYEHGII